MRKLALILAALALPMPAMADTRIDTTITVDKRDGFCEWVIIDGQKPVEIGPADILYWRTSAGTFSSVSYYAFGLDWTRYKWVRLPCVHPLYARLTSGTPAPSTCPAAPNVSAELAAIRAAATAIEVKVR